MALISGLPGPVNLIVISASMLALLLGAAALIVLAAVFAAKSCPRKVLSVLLALVTPVVLWRPIGWTADCIHLGLTIGLGLGQIGVYSSSSDGAVSAYDWSVGLAGTGRFLIHDPSGQIARPADSQDHVAATASDFAEECAGSAKPLIAHYFVCSF